MLPHRALAQAPEEGILYALLLAIGAIPVAIAIAAGAPFGVEATLGLLMSAAGLVGAVGHVLQRRIA